MHFYNPLKITTLYEKKNIDFFFEGIIKHIKPIDKYFTSENGLLQTYKDKKIKRTQKPKRH